MSAMRHPCLAILAVVSSMEGKGESQIVSIYAQRRGPGTLDTVDRAEAAEPVSGVGPYAVATSGLPKHLTVSVKPATGRAFYAEVGAEITVTPDRKLGSIQTSFACVTELGMDQRDANWENVCLADPNALKPN
jgi:hypothetical protein